MPQETFTLYPQMQDGYLDGNNQVQGDPTLCNKDWWENQLFSWIISLTQGTSYPYMTPGELIDKFASGNYAAPLSISSTSTYTSNETADNTTVYVAGSLFTLPFPDDIYDVFTGGQLRFDEIGTHPITFTSSDMYKRINIGVDYVDDNIQLVITESSESATIDGLSDPGNYSASWKYCGYIILQDIGGTIQSIQQDDITSYGYQVWSNLDSGLVWKGLWDADQNIPDISATTPTKGDYYIVSVEGETDIDGINEWNPGDNIMYTGTAWEKMTPEHNPYGINYRGVWDAELNIPDILNIDKEINDFWVVYNTGETDIDGIIEWTNGDYVLWDDTGWKRIPETVYTMKFQGLWDADTNTPDYATFTPENGDFWVVEKSGFTEVNSISVWSIGNYLIYSNDEWRKLEMEAGGGSGGVGIGTGTTRLQYVGTRTQSYITNVGGLPATQGETRKHNYFGYVGNDGIWDNQTLESGTIQTLFYNYYGGNIHGYFWTENNRIGRITLGFCSRKNTWELSSALDFISEGSKFNYTEDTRVFYLPGQATDANDPITDLGANGLTVVEHSTMNYDLTDTPEGIGTASVVFTGSSYLEVQNPQPIIDFGSSEWTISCWIKWNNTGSDQVLFSTQTVTGDDFTIYITSTGNLSFRNGGSGWTSNTTLDHDTWNFLTISFDNTTADYPNNYLFVYKDGGLSSTIRAGDYEFSYTGGSLYIGHSEYLAGNFNGKLSDIVIHNGTCHYREGYTTPLYSEYELEQSRGDLPKLDPYQIQSPTTKSNAAFIIGSDATTTSYINSVIIQRHDIAATLQFVAEVSPLDPNGYGIATEAYSLMKWEYDPSVNSEVRTTLSYDNVNDHMTNPLNHFGQDSIDHDVIQNKGDISHAILDAFTNGSVSTITNSGSLMDITPTPTETSFYGTEVYNFDDDIGGIIENWQGISGDVVDVMFHVVNQDDEPIELEYTNGRGELKTTELDLTQVNTLGYATTHIINESLDIPNVNYRGNALYIPGDNNDPTMPLYIPYYNFSITGSVVYSDTESYYGDYSIYFDGSSTLNIPAGYQDFDLGDNRPCSIGLWINTTATNSPNLLHNSTIQSYGWYISLYPSGLTIGGVDNGEWDTGLTGINDGNWHYISIVKDGNTISVWTDGANKVSETFTSINYDDTDNLVIGATYVGYMEDLILTREVLWSTDTFTVPDEPFSNQLTPFNVQHSEFYLYSDYVKTNSLVNKPDFYNLVSIHDLPEVIGTVTHDWSETTYGNSTLRFQGDDSYLKYPYNAHYHLSDDKPWSIFFRFKPELGKDYRGIWGIMDEDWEGLCLTYDHAGGENNNPVVYVEGYKSDTDDWEWGAGDPSIHGHTVNLEDGNWHSVLVTYYPVEQKIIIWYDGKNRSPIEHTVIGFTNTFTGFFLGSMGDPTWDDGNFRGHIKEFMFMNHSIIVPFDTEEFADDLLLYQYSEKYNANLYISPETTSTRLHDTSLYNHDLVYDHENILVDNTDLVLGKPSIQFDGNSWIKPKDSGDCSYFAQCPIHISFYMKLTVAQTGNYSIMSAGSTDASTAWFISVNNGSVHFGRNGNTVINISDASLCDDTWHHVHLYTYDDERLHCYIDGTESSITSNSYYTPNETWLATNGILEIGGTDETVFAVYPGKLAEICIQHAQQIDIVPTLPANSGIDLSSGISFNKSISGNDFMLLSSQDSDTQLTHVIVYNKTKGVIASWPEMVPDLEKVIDDDGTQLDKTWSASKLNTDMSTITNRLDTLINDSATSSEQTWSGDKIASEFAQLGPYLTVKDDTDTVVNVSDISFDASSFDVQMVGPGSAKVVYIGTGGGGGTQLRCTWKVNGLIPVKTNLDMSRLPGSNGTISKVIVILEDTGTGGSNLVVDIMKNGTSIYGVLSKPTITANSGTFQSTISTTFDDDTVLSNDLFTIDSLSAPTDSMNLVVELIIE